MLRFLLLVLATALVSSQNTPVLPAYCHHKTTTKFKVDTALITIINDESKAPLVVSVQSEECVGCALIPEVTVVDNCTIRVDARWPMRVQVQMLNTTMGTLGTPFKSCSEQTLTCMYQEGGDYGIYVQSEDRTEGGEKVISCVKALMNDPDDPNIPIYVAISIAVFLALMWNILRYLYRIRGYIHRVLCFWTTDSMMTDLGTPTNVADIGADNTSGQGQGEVKIAPKKERLKSLDTFRGLAIVIMIFVNYGGGRYWFFRHSKWNGLTLADTVFAWFIWIMGTAMVYSFQGQLRRGVPKWQIFLNILKRSATLFLLGMLLINNSTDIPTLRVPGVLQRFAGTYLITATVFLMLAPHNSPSQMQTKYVGMSAVFRDILPYWAEWLVHLTFVAVHLMITFLMPVPGCPTGYLGPGGLENNGTFFNCTGGAAGYIDRQLFGDPHIYGHPTSTEIYKQSVPYDPEGLLGTLNSCFMCFLGLQAGKILFCHTDWIKRCRRFFVWSLITGGLALLLCSASENDGWIPINKNLWSLSFVLALSSMAFFLLMLFYIIIDIYKLWDGAPFYYAGMNSIALYCGHEFFSGRAPVSFVVPMTHASQLALNLWGTTFWVLVSVYFYFKNIFISV